jgi:hypothetical protein
MAYGPLSALRYPLSTRAYRGHGGADSELNQRGCVLVSSKKTAISQLWISGSAERMYTEGG